MLFTHPVASRVGVGPEGSFPPRGNGAKEGQLLLAYETMQREQLNHARELRDEFDRLLVQEARQMGRTTSTKI